MKISVQIASTSFIKDRLQSLVLFRISDGSEFCFGFDMIVVVDSIVIFFQFS